MSEDLNEMELDSWIAGNAPRVIGNQRVISYDKIFDIAVQARVLFENDNGVINLVGDPFILVKRGNSPPGRLTRIEALRDVPSIYAHAVIWCSKADKKWRESRP